MRKEGEIVEARIWTPAPSDNNWDVTVDLEVIIENTNLPVPVLVEFDNDKCVGDVTKLFIVDDCLHAYLDLQEEFDEGLVPAAGWRAQNEKGHYTVECLFALGLVKMPAVAGTWIGKPTEDTLASGLLEGG